MFRAVRGDTRVDTIEARYGIDLNCRGDAAIGNVLRRRGFDSVTQLVRAHRGQATSLSRKRRLFLSFHAEDRAQVQGFRLMSRNPNLALDFYDGSLTAAIDSEQSPYVKRLIKEKIQAASVAVCLIGNGTAWRDWVDWELRTAYSLGKGICGVRLKGSRGQTPPLLRDIDAPVARWDMGAIVAAIECAAARRS